MQADEPAAREVERLIIAERAAREAGESAARWWREFTRPEDAVAAPHSFDDLFRNALGTIRRALDADTISLLVADEDGAELLARASVGLEEEVHRNLRIRAGQGMAGKVLATRRPVVVDDLSAIDLASPVLRERGLASVVAVPLLAGERILGVLHAGSYERAHFDMRDAKVLTLVAGRLAGAMERVWLLEVERTARHEAEELSDRLRRLQAVTSALARATDVEAVARTVDEMLTGGYRLAEGASDHSERGAEVASDGPGTGRWRRATLWMASDDEGGPAVRAVRAVRPGHTDAADAADVAATGDRCPPPVLAALRGGAPVVVEVDPSPPATEAVPGEQGPADPSSLAATAVFPVAVDGHVIGALEVVHGRPHHFSRQDRELLAIVSEQVAQALDRVRLLAEQQRLVRTSGFLADAARVIAEADGYQAALVQLAELGLAVLGDICLVDVVDDYGSLVRMVARHRDPARQPLVDRLHSDYPPDPDGRHPVVEVIRSGRSSWSPDMDDQFMIATTRDDDHLALTRALDFRSYLSVPLRAAGAVLGAVTLISTRQPFVPDDVSFAEALAREVASVVDGARRYEGAFHTSKILQDHLLPRQSPVVPGTRIHAQYLAATRGVEIGGDFFDAWEVSPGRVALVIGDVAGHDREAAAMMGQLRSAMRALFDEAAVPADVVAALSAGWERMGFARMATALFGLLEPSGGDLILASAGHCPPLVLKGGTVRYLPVPPNLPLGTGLDRDVESWSGRLDEDTVLLLYTDGAIQERLRGIDGGMARLAAQATAGPPDPGLLCRRVVADLPPSRSDDVALLAVARDVRTARDRRAAG